MAGQRLVHTIASAVIAASLCACTAKNEMVYPQKTRLIEQSRDWLLLILPLESTVSLNQGSVIGRGFQLDLQRKRTGKVQTLLRADVSGDVVNVDYSQFKAGRLTIEYYLSGHEKPWLLTTYSFDRSEEISENRRILLDRLPATPEGLRNAIQNLEVLILKSRRAAEPPITASKIKSIEDADRQASRVSERLLRYAVDNPNLVVQDLKHLEKAIKPEGSELALFRDLTNKVLIIAETQQHE